MIRNVGLLAALALLRRLCVAYPIPLAGISPEALLVYPSWIMSTDSPISHVSDTALMVAACRALETDRPDGMMRDQFAGRLAGERGMAIARALPDLEIMCFGVGLRSRFLDDLLTHALSKYPIEVVVSLGAGLDARPWRLALPASLRWIEVDFQDMLDYKAAVMASEAPRCRLERMAADLNKAEDRQRLYSSLGDGPALLIMEGVLMYLPENTVQALASESAAVSALRYCILDMTSPEFARRSGTGQAVAHVRSTTGLNGEQIRQLLERNEWSALERRSYLYDVFQIAGERILKIIKARAAAGTLDPPPADDMSGVYLLGRG